MIEIYARHKLKNRVSLLEYSGLWACHIENKHKYNLQDLKPVAIVEDLPAAAKLFNNRNLCPFGWPINKTV